jgi:hypothetical protein
MGLPLEPMFRHSPASWSSHGSVQRGMAVLHSLEPTPPSLQSAEPMQAMHEFFTQCGMLLLRGQSVEARHWTQIPASRSHRGVLVPAHAEAWEHGVGSGTPPDDASPPVSSSTRGSHPAAELSARAAIAANCPRVRIGDLEPRRDRLGIDLGLACFLSTVSNRRALEQARFADQEQTGNRALPHTP